MPPRPLALRLIPERLARRSKTSKRSPAGRNHGNREGNSLKKIVGAVAVLLSPCLACGQKAGSPTPAQAVQAVREYRMENENRIVRELSEFLAIPNIASDTSNIQKNAAHLVEMLEARGIETHLLPITGRGPVVFGKLISPEAKRTVIFYAHYDGQPVDPAAWTDGAPFEPVLRSAAIEAGGKRIPFTGNGAGARAAYNDDWRIYARSASDDKSPIVALLAALDALRAKAIPLAVNLKVILEGEAEKKALAAMPENDPDLERELGIAKPEGAGKKLVELIMEPSLNVRGLRSAYVGSQAQNVVPDRAEASLDVRLVRGEDPQQKFDQIAEFIRRQGFYAIDHEPTMEERRAHARIAKVIYEGGYRASRTAMDLPVSQALVKVVEDATEGSTVIAPALGGSVPMYIFEDLGLPWIGVPIVNYDNHQHSSDENLRLGHFWRGMEIYGAILADLNW